MPHTRIIWLSLLGITLLLGGAVAAAPDRPALPQRELWTPSLNLSQTNGRSYWPQILSNPRNGDLWALWTEYTDALFQEEVFVRHRLGATGTWPMVVNLSRSPARDGGPAMYVEEAGPVHLVWSRRDSAANRTDLLYRRWDGSSWSPETIIDRSDAYHPSPYNLIFLRDGTDQLCLFVTEGSGLTHTCLQENGWDELDPWIYIFGMKALSDIVLGPDGRFHIAALGQNQCERVGPCDPWLQDAYYTSTDGQDWDPLLNLSHFGSIAYDIHMVFDLQGRLHFFWSDIHSYCSLDSERSAIYERVLEGGLWGERQQVTLYNDDQAIIDIALEIDTLGQIHLAWSEGMFNADGQAVDLGIRYARQADDTWSKEEIIHLSPEDSLNVDMALIRRGEPLLVWEEGASTAEDVYFSERTPRLYYTFLSLAVKTASTACR